MSAASPRAASSRRVLSFPGSASGAKRFPLASQARNPPPEWQRPQSPAASPRRSTLEVSTARW
ncbi:hypothetical protein [Geobacter sp.]|uniref:hypothetical protein n=1 Tax=Geobacter sp. TaxID=46610 RepID=UPI0026201939|nr:hypothetical protein [Geobacter sp.]